MLERVTGSDNQIGVVVKTNSPFSAKTVDYITRLTEVEAHHTGRSSIPVPGLSRAPSISCRCPARTSSRDGVADQGVLRVSPSLKKELVAEDGRALNVIFLSRTNDFAALEPMIQNLDSEPRPRAGSRRSPAASEWSGWGAGEPGAPAGRSLPGAPVRRGVPRRPPAQRDPLPLSLVLVLVAVGAVTLLAVGLGVKLSPLTAVSGPLVVAVDRITSLILLRFVEERRRGLPAREAMTVTAGRTGRAFMVSAMTAVAGIAVIATSPMPMLRDFGIVMALNVVVALISGCSAPPPVLVWAEETGGWVSRGLLRPVPEPIAFTVGSAVPLCEVVLPEPVGAARVSRSHEVAPRPTGRSRAIHGHHLTGGSASPHCVGRHTFGRSPGRRTGT